MLQADGHVVAGDPIARALRPLDEHEGIFADHFIPAEVLQLRRGLEAIEIEMIDRRSRRLITMDERERRAGDVFRDTVPATDRLHEGRLSRAQLAADRDQQRRRRHSAETLAPFDELRLIEREMALSR